MPLIVNLHHLSTGSLHLQGELTASELDIDTRDEMVRLTLPVWHDLEIEKIERSLLVRGQLRVTLDCCCVRCLKPFERRLDLDEWTCHVPLEGEEHAPVVRDCVDLTPFIREDILLAFPPHPLCDPACCGLGKTQSGKAGLRSAGLRAASASAWAELDKLKF